MKGTAPDMEIAENLSIASKRGVKRRFVRGVRKADREYYRELLKTLDLGLEDRLSTKVGLLSGGQRQAVTLLMASMNKPKLLLLDEHTAALDPKTAAKVLELTDKIVTENHLTTLMITHNMRDAITHGNRLIMLHEGKVIIDVEGEEKKMLTVEHLLSLFVKASGKVFADDRAILA
jgi:putative ABC transport system ATP-binding protein